MAPLDRPTCKNLPYAQFYDGTPRQMGVGGLGLGCLSTPYSLPGNCNIVVQEPAIRQAWIGVTALPLILCTT